MDDIRDERLLSMSHAQQGGFHDAYCDAVLRKFQRFGVYMSKQALCMICTTISGLFFWV